MDEKMDGLTDGRMEVGKCISRLSALWTEVTNNVSGAQQWFSETSGYTSQFTGLLLVDGLYDPSQISINNIIGNFQ